MSVLVFFYLSSVVWRDSKVFYSVGSLLFFKHHKVLLSKRDKEICLYFKIPDNIVHIILPKKDSGLYI